MKLFWDYVGEWRWVYKCAGCGRLDMYPIFPPCGDCGSITPCWKTVGRLIGRKKFLGARTGGMEIEEKKK